MRGAPEARRARITLENSVMLSAVHLINSLKVLYGIGQHLTIGWMIESFNPNDFFCNERIMMISMLH